MDGEQHLQHVPWSHAQSNRCSRQLLIRPHLHQEVNCTRRPDWSPNRPHFAVTTCTAPPSRSYTIHNTEHTSLYLRRNSEIRITVFTDVMPCGLVDTNVSEIPFSLQGAVWKRQVSLKHLYLTNYTTLRRVFEELKSQTWQISYTAWTPNIMFQLRVPSDQQQRSFNCFTYAKDKVLQEPNFLAIFYNYLNPLHKNGTKFIPSFCMIQFWY
jgi:hypothetical protein